MVEIREKAEGIIPPYLRQKIKGEAEKQFKEIPPHLEEASHHHGFVVVSKIDQKTFSLAL